MIRLTPGQIKSIRQRYGLSKSSISKVTGIGRNQWAKYEAGEIPSTSNSALILMMANPDSMLMLLDCYGGDDIPDFQIKKARKAANNIKELILHAKDQLERNIIFYL